MSHGRRLTAARAGGRRAITAVLTALARSRRRPAAAACSLCALCVTAPLLAGCGDTLQTKPIPHNILESMVVAPFPVYWLGESFIVPLGRTPFLQVTEANEDASGSFTVEYGNCLQGGEGTCTPPLRVVTSPDNSFVPGGDTPRTTESLRGVRASVTDDGRTISIPTGGVVITVFAADADTARAAAEEVAPINRPEGPRQTLPARRPDTGFGSRPLPSQLPSTVRPLG
jgi:hypothetical protein